MNTATPSFPADDSIAAILANARSLGVDLWNQDGQLRFRAPQGALTDALREQLKRNREQVLACLAGSTPGPADTRQGSIAADWFKTWQPRPHATQRVICLPHAGGSASFFRHWGAALPAHVELIAVQYPGREERIDAPLISDLTLLVTAIADALQRTPHLLQQPYLLFGHSMGSALAYELHRALQQRGLPLAQHLLLSACEAPSRRKAEAFHLASDQRLMDEMLRLGGTQDAMAHSPELMELVLPVTRSDYQAIETYVPDPQRLPVSVPITALTGDEFHGLDLGDALAWADETTAGFVHRGFPGGHFYLMQQQDGVLDVVRAALEQLPRR
ncbi:alpha/beta fold hydrolase [Pseudomonas cremoricolorata]|uniref:alpha/beta fold hydrolase n=1 Tax=Pseudomonas cremoricolorata TaxID=157783 RepID=UPI000412C321|nr:alpha/beta fold hydrolase [Pseudomonas cremoricolorata]